MFKVFPNPACIFITVDLFDFTQYKNMNLMKT